MSVLRCDSVFFLPVEALCGCGENGGYRIDVHWLTTEVAVRSYLCWFNILDLEKRVEMRTALGQFRPVQARPISTHTGPNHFYKSRSYQQAQSKLLLDLFYAFGCRCIYTPAVMGLIATLTW